MEVPGLLGADSSAPDLVCARTITSLRHQSEHGLTGSDRRVTSGASDEHLKDDVATEPEGRLPTDHPSQHPGIVADEFIAYHPKGIDGAANPFR
jgi:hypothetical protein